MTELKTIDSDTISAGREMDALVAELMGWMIYPFDEHRGNHEWLDNLANYPYLTDQHGYYLLWRKPKEDGERWSPSTSIAVAWKVWDWAKEDKERWVKFVWALPGAPSGVHSLCRELTPLAICRAALKAKE